MFTICLETQLTHTWWVQHTDHPRIKLWLLWLLCVIAFYGGWICGYPFLLTKEILRYRGVLLPFCLFVSVPLSLYGVPCHLLLSSCGLSVALWYQNSLWCPLLSPVVPCSLSVALWYHKSLWCALSSLVISQRFLVSQCNWDTSGDNGLTTGETTETCGITVQ